MKLEKLFSLLFISTLAFACSDSEDNNSSNSPVDPDQPSAPQECPFTGKKVVIADFESDSTTPAFAKYGNRPTMLPGQTTNSSDPTVNGAEIDLKYKPRWVYAHNVVANPQADDVNKSTKVLSFSSMEARDFGVKVRLAQPISIDDIEGVKVRIMQPKNVIGKSTWNNIPVASKQKVCVKLLSYINLVQDYRLDHGLELIMGMGKGLEDFTQENQWVDVYFKVNKQLYPVDYKKFTDGIVGVAILPTYNSNTTLSEEQPYQCFIDDVTIYLKSK